MEAGPLCELGEQELSHCTTKRQWVGSFFGSSIAETADTAPRQVMVFRGFPRALEAEFVEAGNIM